MEGLKDMKKSKRKRKAIAGTFMIYGFDLVIMNTFHGDCESFMKYR